MKKKYILLASLMLCATIGIQAQSNLQNKISSHNTSLSPATQPNANQLQSIAEEEPLTYSFNFVNEARPNPNSLDSNINFLPEIGYWNFNGDYPENGIYYFESSAFDSAYFENISGYSSAELITLIGYHIINEKWTIITSYYYHDDGDEVEGDPAIDRMDINFSDNPDLSIYSKFAVGSLKSLRKFEDDCGNDGEEITWGIYIDPDVQVDPNAPIPDPIWFTVDGPSDDGPYPCDTVIINAPHTSDGFEAKSVELNSDLTLIPNVDTSSIANITSVNGFTGDGKIIMQSNSEIIIFNPEGLAPKVEITHTTKPMRRYDYTFISNPIDSPSEFFTQILDGQRVIALDIVEEEAIATPQPLSAFNQLRTFNDEGTSAVDATYGNTPLGRGFSATVRNQAPYSTSNVSQAWDLEMKRPIQITITGQANNGPIGINVPENGWLRLGNPYLSIIKYDILFYGTNDKLSKTLYYWSHHTARGSLADNTSYTNTDFGTYNNSGGTRACGTCPLPTGDIGIMESVLIRSFAAPSNTKLYLDNYTPETPLKQAPSLLNGKFRLNLKGSQNSFSQILIAYNPENGSDGYDNGYDSSRLQGLKSELSSLINNSRYTIQTKGAFSTTDVVKLRLDKRKEETFTINLANVEGLLVNTPIILHDKTLGIYHDLTTAPYAFVQSVASDTQRFDVVYESPLLNTNDLKTVTAFAFISNNTFNAQANQEISEIMIYDMSGRLIRVFSNIQESLFTNSFSYGSGIYIAKIKLTDGTTVTQKLMK